MGQEVKEKNTVSVRLEEVHARDVDLVGHGKKRSQQGIRVDLSEKGVELRKESTFNQEPARQSMPKVRAGPSWPGSAGAGQGVSYSEAWAGYLLGGPPGVRLL